MIRILMVCLGNICRSPVAEGVMRKILEDKRIPAIVDSAGTAGYHIGEAPDIRSSSNALKHGIDIRGLKARQFKVSDFDKFDVIYVMDRSNLSNVLSLAQSENHKKKVSLLLTNKEVPDPYYGGEAGFENVFQLIHEACEKLSYKF